MLYNFSNLPKGIKLCQILKADKIRRKSVPVDFANPESVRELIWKMVRACVVNRGVGLAAPQIGVFKRMFIAEEAPGNFRAYLNPGFTVISGSAKCGAVEGCLSVPGKNVLVSRFVSIAAFWAELTEDGGLEEHEDILVDQRARVFQHELDHLSGIDILVRGGQKK